MKFLEKRVLPALLVLQFVIFTGCGEKGEIAVYTVPKQDRSPARSMPRIPPPWREAGPSRPAPPDSGTRRSGTIRRADAVRSPESGCRIRTLRWGARDRPGVVLVHGGAAHAHWWVSIAPHLARDYAVVALDLSGHGDSGCPLHGQCVEGLNIDRHLCCCCILLPL